MSDSSTQAGALLERYADFYEEVARIKLAIREGNLPLYLAGNSEQPQTNGIDQAAMISQRLKSRMLDQLKRVRQSGTKAEIEAYRMALYVMAAQADELFILGISWDGKDAWQEYLLERSLFGSATAGRDFFRILARLLKSRGRDPLREELATVFLMALQLGFQGQYRGALGKVTLARYRARLKRFIGRGGNEGLQKAFPQAYQFPLNAPRGERIAPLSRWYTIAMRAFMFYLVLSTIIWLVIVDRFNSIFGG